MQRVSAIGLLLIFLAAQLGVTIGTHYCQGEAVHTKMLLGASDLPGCGMEEVDGACENDNGRSQLNKHCCEDERKTFRNEREQIPSSPQRIDAPFSEVPTAHAGQGTEQIARFDAFRSQRELSPPLEDAVHSPSRYASQRLQVFRI